MLGVKFTLPMKKAWVWLSLYLLSLSLLRLVRPSESLDVNLVLFAKVLLDPGVLIFLIYSARCSYSAGQAEPASSAGLSTWGWFWRAFILHFFQIPVFLLVSLFLPISLNVQSFGALQLVLWEVPFALASAIGAWLLFSKDRKGQLRLLITSLRGY